jgi:hypothetical protein
MGHLVFLLIHVAAVLFFPLALWVTLPLHLIYGVVGGSRRGDSPSPWTHVRCPDCKEVVRNDARVCRHCGCRLAPEA